MGQDIRENSKTAWVFANDEDLPGSTENITLGCMLRIADATELMAKDRLRMDRDLAYYKDGYSQLQQILDTRDKTIASLRGWITRLKNKQS